MIRGVCKAGAICLAMAVLGCSTAAPIASAPSAPEAKASPAPQLTSAVARINYYRGLVSFPGITIVPRLDKGAADHARYVLENNLEPVDFTYHDGQLKQFKPPPGVHEEDPHNPWYTPEGEEAAKFCDVFEASSVPLNGGAIVDQFMTTPFMAMSTLDPTQSGIGYGQICNANKCIVVTPIWIGFAPGWDTYFAEDNTIQRVKLSDDDVERLWLKTPRQFPPPGSDLPNATLGNFDYLDPLTACPGYTHPAGAPILLSIGWARDADASVMLSAHSLSEDGKPIESCAFDATSYTNPNLDQQKLFRSELIRTLGAVMIPKAPLKPGHTYEVAMTLNSKTYQWSFKVGPVNPGP